jgi:hypothetical protein
MIEPVTTVAALLGGHRLAAAAEWVYARRSDERTQRELIRCSGSLPPGTEVGQSRADGSRWWIRTAAAQQR